MQENCCDGNLILFLRDTAALLFKRPAKAAHLYSVICKCDRQRCHVVHIAQKFGAGSAVIAAEQYIQVGVRRRSLFRRSRKHSNSFFCRFGDAIFVGCRKCKRIFSCLIKGIIQSAVVTNILRDAARFCHCPVYRGKVTCIGGDLRIQYCSLLSINADRVFNSNFLQRYITDDPLRNIQQDFADVQARLTLILHERQRDLLTVPTVLLMIRK